jgi:outer membrane protein OmpA-like peptidoglycan-associated protein
VKRVLILAAPAVLLAGCASKGDVTLLPGEGGASAGAVAVLDPKTGAEKGALTEANTQTRLRGRVAVKSADPNHWSFLANLLPPQAAHFTLYFQTGGSTLTPESEDELKKVLDEIAKRPGADLLITGYTDTTGNADDNDNLSLRRAEDIQRLVIDRGVNPTISRAVGRGMRDLLVQTPPGVDEPRNRRVEITIR